MKRRLRLVESKEIILKTTRVDFSELKERVSRVPQGKHAAKYDNPYVSIPKSMLLNLIGDTEVLTKALKGQGVTVGREPHYNETKEWKSWAKQNYPDNDVPAFLKAGKKKRVKL